MSATANTAARTWSVRLRQRAADWAQASPGRRSAAGHPDLAAGLHPADARRIRVRGTAAGDAARGTQLLEQHGDADHLPAGRIRADRDAPVPPQSGRHRGPQHRHRRCVRRRTRAPAADAGEYRRLVAHRPRMRHGRLAIACSSMCRPDASARADVAIPLAASRPLSDRARQTIYCVSLRPVPCLDLDPRAAGRARLAGAARPPRATAAGRERRQRSVRGARR